MAIDHFRIVDGDRLMWASARDHLGRAAAAFRPADCAQDPHDFSARLGKVEISEVWGGAVGQTVHGMPQIGQLRKGLWVTSGFGRQGMNTSAMAGHLIAQGILWGDDRWRLFSPFELVWAGGSTGRVVGHAVGAWTRGASAAAGALARYREKARVKERIREARLAEANRQAGTRPPRRRPPRAARVPSVPDRPPRGKPRRRRGGFFAFSDPCGTGWVTRKKVREFRPNRCNFHSQRPVFEQRTMPVRPHGDHHDRSPYSARLHPPVCSGLPPSAGCAARRHRPRRNSRSKRPTRNGVRN